MFLSNMSHELRTPLNAILGFSQLLQMTLDETKHQEQLSYIVKSGEHLLKLIDEILNLSKIETGHVELSMETVFLYETVCECKRLLDVQAEAKNITITVGSELNSNEYIVYADHTRIRQVILNILSNAVKYNKESGSIKISTHKNQQNKLVLSITDTNTGREISPKHLKEMFKPFNRLDAETTSIEGTGIGLVITKKLIELMDGRIYVTSNEGEGSTFSIEIPLAELSDEQRNNFQASQDYIEKDEVSNDNVLPKLLYIEDNPVNTKLVKMLLEKKQA
ncbi:MAG: ATP-binding protein [Methylococcales bacterium]|nr:ATP-binding protein [Methylococcales bacterium]